MKELLPFFKNPSHYLGEEINSIHKREDDVKLRWALAFPDIYPVAVSYFGQHILYHILNSNPHIWAERVYAPSLEVGEVLKRHHSPLCTLESDTPLNKMDVVGFSLTHELCYTTVLYMLDLADIPFYAREREDGNYPLIIAGGEAVCNPEPLREIFDLFVIGDGEEVIEEISAVLLDYPRCDWRRNVLRELASIEGVLIPGREIRRKIRKRIYTGMEIGRYPVNQIVPFGRPVHDRYTLEISKGCTRGCRFCYAGMVNRPVRERPTAQINEIMMRGVKNTGYGEVGFLSLSTGDFSDLSALFSLAFQYCFPRQISISLPSLRAGSVGPEILKSLSRLKRTGLTLAPEAGTQRLRDVINKGITEEDIISHVRWAFQNGWEHLKLYFMIGLPTETEEDIRGIWELAKGLLSLAPSRRITIGVSISPFVPKPHTPFQWEAQDNLEETRRKISYLRRLFKRTKRLKLSWPLLEMSIIEGVFSRGDSALGRAIVEAYKRGDVFTGWRDFFDFKRWIEVFDSLSLDYNAYLGPREETEELPWDYIDVGVNKSFLLRERERAKKAELTLDCRWGKCAGCGACDFEGVRPFLNLARQAPSQELVFKRDKGLQERKYLYRVWFKKGLCSSYLSQIELQSVLDRILRRAEVPVSFSGGYHPRPRLSFSRALPVGVESYHEWFLLNTHQPLSEDVLERLNKNTISGLRFISLERLSSLKEVYDSRWELFFVRFQDTGAEIYLARLLGAKTTCIFIEKKGKKIRAGEFVEEVWKREKDEAAVVFSWERGYFNPLLLVQYLSGADKSAQVHLIKVKQFFTREEMEGWKRGEYGGYGEG